MHSMFIGNKCLDLSIELDGVSFGQFGEFLEAGQRGCEGEERGEVAGFAFVAHGQPPVAEDPGDRPLDLPAPAAQSLAGLDAALGSRRTISTSMPSSAPCSTTLLLCQSSTQALLAVGATADR